MNPEQKKYIFDHLGKKLVKQIAEDLHLDENEVREFIRIEKSSNKLQKDRNTKNESSQINPRPHKFEFFGKRHIFLALILLLVIGFAIYFNSLNGGFVFDDKTLIVKNPDIKSLSNIPNLFVSDIGEGPFRSQHFYRPFQMVTYSLDYVLWSLNPLGYHLTNTILHSLVALMFFLLIMCFCEDKKIAILASLLFIVHPIHTEAVSYIAGRADPLVTLFGFLTIFFYIQTTTSNKAIYYALLIISYTLACLSKEYSIVIPFLILFYHHAFKVSIKKRPISSIFIIALIYMIIRKMVLGFKSTATIIPDPFIERLTGFFVAFWQYVKLIFLPFDLHMEYGSGHFKSFDLNVLTGIIIFSAFIWYLLKEKQKRGIVYFSLGWFLIALLPMSNLYPINAYMAEHWLYFPSMGFFLLISIWFSKMYTNKKLKFFAIAVAVSLISYYVVLTVKQNNYWKDPIRFYETTLRYAPNSVRILSNLGIEYSHKGEKEKAIEAFKKAVALDPNDADTYNNLGAQYLDPLNAEEAISAFKKSIELNSQQADAYNNIGIVYYRTGREEDAMASFKKATEINPNQEDGYNNLAYAYCRQGDLKQAIILYERAIEINPNNAERYRHLGDVYFSDGQYERALACYQNAIKRGYDGDNNFSERVASLKVKKTL